MNAILNAMCLGGREGGGGGGHFIGAKQPCIEAILGCGDCIHAVA